MIGIETCDRQAEKQIRFIRDLCFQAGITYEELVQVPFYNSSVWQRWLKWGGLITRSCNPLSCKATGRWEYLSGSCRDIKALCFHQWTELVALEIANGKCVPSGQYVVCWLHVSGDQLCAMHRINCLPTTEMYRRQLRFSLILDLPLTVRNLLKISFDEVSNALP